MEEVEPGVIQELSSIQAIESRFTNINTDSCTLIEEQPAYFRYDCGGLSGYKLHVEDSDLRANVRVIFGSADMDLQVSGKIGGSAFTFLGNTADWRGATTGTTFEPYAVTFRVTSQNVQYLVVAKVGKTKSCQYKVYNASIHPNANDLARAAADASRTASCPTTLPDPE